MESNLLTFRTDRSKNYKTISLTCLQDTRLSWKAKGLHSYLVTRPDNWEVRRGDLLNRSIDKATSTHSGLKELITHGYLFRMCSRNKKGQFLWGYLSTEVSKTEKEARAILKESGWELTDSDEEEDNPDPETPHIENPLVGNQSLNNKKDNNKKRKINRRSLISNDIKDKVSPKPNSNPYLKPNSSVKQTQSKEKILTKAPAKVAEVLDYWKEKGLHLPKQTTISYRSSINAVSELFKGTAFKHTEYERNNKQFTMAEIKRVIDRFAQAATDVTYLPLGKIKGHLQKMPPQTFIYNKYTLNGNARKSQFIYYLLNKPSPARTPVPDEHPKLTKAIKEEYRKEILGGAETKFTIEDENKFIAAAQRAVEFFRVNRAKLASYITLNESKVAGWMVRAVKDVLDDVKLNQVTPGWLCSNNMFNQRLPAYLYAQAMIAKPQEEYTSMSEPVDSDGRYKARYYEQPENFVSKIEEEEPPASYEVDDV